MWCLVINSLYKSEIFHLEPSLGRRCLIKIAGQEHLPSFRNLLPTNIIIFPSRCALIIGAFQDLTSPSFPSTFSLHWVANLLHRLNFQPLTEKQLIKVTFHRAATGEYHCPVLFKPFTNTTHIVANKLTGNVFSYEVTSVRSFVCDGDSGNLTCSTLW